jgi:ribonucleoside-diphosphate reductase alpha chain
MSNFYPPEAVASILSDRYFQEGEDWEALCKRVSESAAKTEPEENREEWQTRFYEMIREGRGLPNTPALINLGANHKGCVAACFSFRPLDSMDSILEMSRLAAMTLKFGGGAGFELSLLRPEGTAVQSTHKQAMGPVGVMKFYNAVGDMITQAGVRKAALIALLRIDHPDIIKFCRAKEEDQTLANFNISASITDNFMKKLAKEPNKPHICHFVGKQYHLLPDGNAILKANRGSQKVLSVQEVYNVLCQKASVNGDPGVFFVDQANKNNPLINSPNDIDNPFYLAGCNPCSEIPLSCKEACLLGSIDLAKFVVDKELDTSALSREFRTMTRFLEDMIDVSAWPDLAIKEKVLQTRRIGVGVMGFASALDKLGVKYGSDECIKIIDVIGTIRETACTEESKQLAKERGVYPAAPEGEKRRNVAHSCIAPTGTLAMIANTSWSIEPHLYWAFEERRNDTVRTRYLPAVLEYIESDTLSDLEDTANGDLSHLNVLIQSKLPEHMVLAKEITPEQHLKVVATWQKYTDSSISKTICAPAEILTPEKVGEIYKEAWENKLKGLTVYPEGSRQGEPMSIGHKKKKPIKSLPQSLKSDRHEFQVQLGSKMRKVFAFVGLDPEDESQPIEVFLKHPYVQDPMAIQFIDLTTRLLSLALRYRTCSECGQEAIPLGKVIKQLRETDGQSMFSVPSIFVKALGKYLPNGEAVGNCPTPGCKGKLTLIEGCECCLSCHFQSCS